MNGDTTELPAKLTTSAGAPAPELRVTVRLPARRRTWELIGETTLEWVIQFCGVSAILFVFGIFFFVVREGAGLLFGGLDLGQFLFSTEWFPTSHSNVRYGVLALIVGTASVTLLAMVMAVPFGLGAAVFVSEFCGKRTQGDPEDRHRAAGRHPLGGLGLHRHLGDEPPHPEGVPRAGGAQRLQRRSVAGADERAHHGQHRRGRPQGGARLLPRGGAGRWGPPAGRPSTGCCCRRPRTACWRRCCWGWAGRWARPWRC